VLDQELPVGELAKRVGVSRPAASTSKCCGKPAAWTAADAYWGPALTNPVETS
jgi:hypothetical protein